MRDQQRKPRWGSATRCPKSRAPVTLAPLVLLAALLLYGAPAFAARGHVFTGTIGEPCPSEPCAGAHLKEPVAVAVNEATGYIYVLDKGGSGVQGRVVVFTAKGALSLTNPEFNGSGALLGEGAAAGSLGNLGELETGRFEEPEAIAVDNSCTLKNLSPAECEAKDPSDGDVYVLDSGHRAIDKQLHPKANI